MVDDVLHLQRKRRPLKIYMCGQTKKEKYILYSVKFQRYFCGKMLLGEATLIRNMRLNQSEGRWNTICTL